MKRKVFSGVLSAALCIAFIVPSTACKSENDGIDKSKTQLYISNYDGGFGSQWLQNIADRFESQYSETCFEPGVMVDGKEKKGVEIKIRPNRDTVATVIEGATEHVFFALDMPINDLASSGKILPITDIVKEESLTDVSAGKESGTIAEKMDLTMQKALTGINDEYYALPHFMTMLGINYDAALFAREGFYFKDKGDGAASYTEDAEENRQYVFTADIEEATVGPNGVRGDYDDGLPSDYEEFKALVREIYSSGVAPFIWTGNYNWYTNFIGVAAWSAYAGKDQSMLEYNFGTGGAEPVTLDYVTGIDSFGNPIIEKTEITPENAYLNWQSAARFYSMQIEEFVLSNKNYLSEKYSGTSSHTDAQLEYVMSDLERNQPGGQSIAMLVEGSWWYNEATEQDIFKMSEQSYGNLARNRDFRFMPMPWKADGGVKEGEGRKPTVTVAMSNSDSAVINANIKNENIIRLAKLFLKFCYTDESLAEAQLISGTPVCMNYKITDDQVATMNNYYQSLQAVAADAEIAFLGSSHPMYVENESTFRFDMKTVVSYKKDRNEYANPYTLFRNKQMNAYQYFQGFNRKEGWTDTYGKYFNTIG